MINANDAKQIEENNKKKEIEYKKENKIIAEKYIRDKIDEIINEKLWKINANIKSHVNTNDFFDVNISFEKNFKLLFYLQALEKVTSSYNNYSKNCYFYSNYFDVIFYQKLQEKFSQYNWVIYNVETLFFGKNSAGTKVTMATKEYYEKYVKKSKIVLTSVFILSVVALIFFLICL